ncbi:MAG: hypothetical protein IIY94_01380 [Oscillospiraceae bacterium]|nr:hypothetical protein [Oscillospiraceae bacterium]
METIRIRRAVAVLLLLTMLLVMLPVSAFADDPPQEMECAAVTDFSQNDELFVAFLRKMRYDTMKGIEIRMPDRNAYPAMQ